MNEENKKLQNVQKSCKGAKIVSRIMDIAFIVATVLTLILGIVMIAGKDKFDADFEKSAQSGKGISTQVRIGPFVLADVENGEIHTKDSLESDIPALNAYFQANADSPSLLFGFYSLFVSVLVALLAVAFALISSVFDTILKEGNPFADKAIKRTVLAMIIVCIIITFTAGWGFGLLGAFLTWVIYNIMDYGRVLKIQSDETL